MKTIDLIEATRPLSEYVKEIAREPVVITYKGVVLAALISVENIDYESIAVSENQKFQEIIERSRRSIREGKGIPAEEIRKEFEGCE